MISWADVQKEFRVVETAAYPNTAAAGARFHFVMQAGSEYCRLIVAGEVPFDPWCSLRCREQDSLGQFRRKQPVM